MKLFLHNLKDTKKLANIIAKILKPEIYLLLFGNLGSGKTTLAKFVIAKLGFNGNVNSPTFVILNQYPTKKLIINHIDFYRMLDLKKSLEIGMYLEEMENAVNIIEWPQLIHKSLKSKTKICIVLNKHENDKISCKITLPKFLKTQIIHELRMLKK